MITEIRKLFSEKLIFSHNATCSHQGFLGIFDSHLNLNVHVFTAISTPIFHNRQQIIVLNGTQVSVIGFSGSIKKAKKVVYSFCGLY